MTGICCCQSINILTALHSIRNLIKYRYTITATKLQNLEVRGQLLSYSVSVDIPIGVERQLHYDPMNVWIRVQIIYLLHDLCNIESKLKTRKTLPENHEQLFFSQVTSDWEADFDRRTCDALIPTS